MLGAFTGTDLARTELIQPIAADKQPLPEIRRPELHLFNAQNSLLRRTQAKAVTAKNNMPRLSAFLSRVLTAIRGSICCKSGFKAYAIGGGIRLSWNFGNFYTKRNDLRQIDVNRDNIAVQRETFLFSLRASRPARERRDRGYRRTLADDGEIITLRDNIKRAGGESGGRGR